MRLTRSGSSRRARSGPSLQPTRGRLRPRARSAHHAPCRRMPRSRRGTDLRAGLPCCRMPSRGCAPHRTSGRIALVVLHSESSSDSAGRVFVASLNDQEMAQSTSGTSGHHGVTVPGAADVTVLQSDGASAVIGSASDGRSQRIVGAGSTRGQSRRGPAATDVDPPRAPAGLRRCTAASPFTPSCSSHRRQRTVGPMPASSSRSEIPIRSSPLPYNGPSPSAPVWGTEGGAEVGGIRVGAEVTV